MLVKRILNVYIRAMTTLNQYLTEKRMTQEAFAALIGATQATVSRLCSDKAQPSKNLMLRIERATGGEVPVLSWFQGAAE